ncbi:MAG: NAD(P)/FAD-dependent oxidoreductase [Phycisphaerae bacterium]
MARADWFDVLILGAGPAGAAAAAAAARAGLRTVVCDRGPAPASGPRLEWLNPAAPPLIDQVGVTLSDAGVATLDRVKFIDVAGRLETRVPLEEPVVLVDVTRLTDGFLQAARSAGAECNLSVPVTRIETHEDHVVLRDAGDGRWASRLLLLADGADASLERDPRLKMDVPASGLAACCERMAVARSVRRRKVDRHVELSIILNAREPTSYGFAYAFKGVEAVGLVVSAATQEAAGEFDRRVRRWADAGIRPAANETMDTVRVRAIPRGVALERETHVGKHALLIGDAGGFVPALSHDGLYAAIRSARIAVEVCAAALTAPQSQDVLAEYDVRWRRELVDTLRLPNSDLRFLIPIVFSHGVMASRMARAFVAGENI